MRILVHVDKKLALMAGNDLHGNIVVDVPAASMSQAQREELVKWPGCDHADYNVSTAPPGQWDKLRQRLSDTLCTVSSATPENVLALLDRLIATRAAVAEEKKTEEARNAEEKQREAAERAAEQQRVISELTAMDDGALLADVTYLREGLLNLDANHRYRNLLAIDEKRYSGFGYPNPQFTIDDAKPIAERIARLLLAENERRQAEMDRIAIEKNLEREAWINLHGSNRLKRMLKEGIDHMAVYRDERLAKDRPGWVFERNVANNEAKYDEPRNVSDEDFELLDRSREFDPEAELKYYTIPCPADEECYDEDGESSKYLWSGCVAMAEFEGKTIVYGVPENVLEKVCS